MSRRPLPSVPVHCRRALLSVAAALQLTACGPAAVQVAAPAPAASSDPATSTSVALLIEAGDWAAADAALGPAKPAQPLALRDRALVDWQLGRDAAARAMEDRLIAKAAAGDAAARDALLALAKHHERARRQPLAALRLLQAAFAERGCQDAAGCGLARQVATSLSRLADRNPADALVLAPAAPLARARWIVQVGDALMTTADAATALRWAEPTVAQLALAAAAPAAPPEAQEAAEVGWLAAFRWHARQPGGKGREQWLGWLERHPQPAALLTALGTQPEIAVHAPLATRLLTMALERPAPPADAGLWRLAALGRSEDAAGLRAALAQQPPTTALGKATAARWWLKLGLPQEAEPYLTELEASQPADAVTLALRAVSHAQRGRAPLADALQAKLAEAQGDRSLAWLLIAQLPRGSWSRGPQALQQAARMPGAGQRAAARELAVAQVRAQPTAAAAVAVQQYAQLLALPAPPPTPLMSDPEPAAADARRQLFDSLSLPTWSEHRAAFVRAWADAGLADAEMLRELAKRSVQEGDLDGFLQREAQAMASAAAEARELGNRDLLTELLAARRGGPWLAAWLQQSAASLPAWHGLPSIDDETQGWLAATQLLSASFGLAGRALALQLWQEGARRDAPPGVLQQLAQHGAADVALRWLAALPTQEARDARLQQEVAARLEVGDKKAAEERIMQVSTMPGQSSRSRRMLVELAADNALCDAVRAVGERLLGDSDEYAHRVAVQRILDCARQRQRDAEAQQLVQVVLGTAPSPQRVDMLGRALADRGYHQLAVQLWRDERAKRPLAEDALATYARSLLTQGQLSEAVPLLHQMVQVRRTPRTMLLAAEMLEDYGLLDLADGFYTQAIALEPDASRPRARRVALALRLRATAPAAEQIRELAARGASPDDWRIVREMAERTDQNREVAEVLAGLPDPDREVDRLRLALYARLGDKEGVLGVLQRLRTRTGQLGAEVVRQLMEVGQWLVAREVAEDDLASAEPGSGVGRRDGFAAALDAQPDRGSATAALRLARLYLGRALDPEQVAPFAAMELGVRGHAQAALQVGAVASRDRDARFAVLRGGYLWDAGQKDEARAVWRQVRAQILLDARLPELLRSWDGRPTHRFDELTDSLSLLLAALVEARDHTELEQWLRELLAVVPTARWPLQRLTLTQLLNGRPMDAARTLLLAIDRLAELDDGLAELADRVVQDGGGEVLLEGLRRRGLWLRTEPWIASLLYALQNHRGVLAETAQRTELEERWRELARHDRGVRLGLAVALAGAGHAAEAEAALGDDALCGAAARSGGALRGAVAVLAALQGAETTRVNWKVLPATERAAERLLACHNTPEIALALAEAAVQQGHPELASWLAAQHVQHDGLSAEAADRLALVQVAAGTDAEAASALLTWVQGRRSQLEFPAQGSAHAPADLALQWALQAGRPAVAKQVATKLRETEPGLAIPALLTEPTAPLARRVQASDPGVWPQVFAERASLPRTVLLEALPLALALAPNDALALGEQLAQRDDEPWRAWLDVYREATLWEEPQVAEQALQAMQRSGAPAGVLACPLAAWQSGDVRACLRGRQPSGLTELERLDVARAVAAADRTDEREALLAALLASTQGTQAALLQAMAQQFATVDRTGQERLAAFARQLLAALAHDAARGNLASAALDDLAAMGVTEAVLQWTTGQWQRHPLGQGSRNNAAYAMHLAGQSAAALPLARPAAFATYGERAHAALDTLAAVLFATGDRDAALATQRRALAAALHRPAPGTAAPRQMGLPIARLSGFLLAAGDAEAARLVAATALQDGDDATATVAARRAWKAAVRAGRR